MNARIAIVEDNADNRLVLEAYLGSYHEVIVFENGPTALAGLPEAKADLVILDISLPGMDGTEVLRLIRLDPELGQLPVVALTAHAMAGDREKYLAAGFDDYVTKPILDEAALLEVIAQQLPAGCRE